MPSQSIRPSQYVMTYGPGSILEGPDGPRVVMSLEKSTVFGSDPPGAYSIVDSSISALLVDDGNPMPVRLPTNSEKQALDSEALYKTTPFPRWSLCVTHSYLYRYSWPQLQTGCPLCSKSYSSKWDAARASRREAVRFVAACPGGHLDDVNWGLVVKHTKERCYRESYRWTGGGGSLKYVTIVCAECGGTANLGQVYGREWPCSGNWPEHDRRDEGCAFKARILQRGAANLHLTELVTSVTIPRLDTRLHQALGSVAVLSLLQVLDSVGQMNATAVRKAVVERIAKGGVPRTVASELDLYDDEGIERAARDVLGNVAPTSENEARLNEFRELQRAATYGHPQTPSKIAGSPPLFEVPLHGVRHDLTIGNVCRLRVAPISRLRVVLAQRGYRRTLSSDPGVLVPSTLTIGQNRYIPGVELFGEGLFIDLAPNDGMEGVPSHPSLDGADAAAWLAGYKSDGDPRKHPVFVWWHTLSHRLIRALGVDSGYSSASVRERVYTRVQNDGTATGGVLLYTVQPGGDGTLGGLIALVSQFERVLRGALADLDACSNDPLCADEHYHQKRANGAICYACGFVSETSCESRNMHLDRNLLLQLCQ